MNAAADRLGLTTLVAVRSPRGLRKLAGALGALCIALPVTLLAVPWQQNVLAGGKVTAFDPLERTQVLPAPVTGRLVELLVVEGDRVEAGQVLARMADQDPQFALRLEQQLEFAKDRVRAARDMVSILDDQRNLLEASRDQAVQSATFAYNVAVETVRATERELDGLSAELEQKRADRVRKTNLWERGVVSELEYQKAEAEYFSSLARVDAARAKVSQARNTEHAKEAEIGRVGNDAQAAIESINSDREAARANLASAEDELAQATTRLERQKTQVVTAPREGTVLRIYAANTADFLSQGTPLIEFIPETSQPAVELWVRGIDAPLISPGRPVRLQFEGWPAVQWAAWPSVAVGTFGGVVAFVDAHGDREGRFRVLVLPRPRRRGMAGERVPPAGRSRQRLDPPGPGQPRLRGVAEPERVPALGEAWRRRHKRTGSGHRWRGRVTRVLAAWLAVLVCGCQASPPLSFRSLAPIPEAVLESFTLEENAGSIDLLPIHVLGRSEEADAEAIDAPAATIELDDVLRSVERHFPLLLAAREEVAIAEAELLSARGAFDTRLSGLLDAQLDGFYQTEGVDLGVQQPLAPWGADLSGGYRLGRGDFAIWDGDEETDGGGELRLGVNVPLLQGRAIDPRRIALWTARIERRQADPVVLEQRLDVARRATEAYWRWLAAGRLREIALRLLALAEDRADQIEIAVEEGLLAPINLVENRRLIVDREAVRVRAERGLQEAAIELSLYWRDAEGRPAIPRDDALPYEFPSPREVDRVLVEGDEPFALGRRPEVLSVELEVQAMLLQVDLARNDVLPRVDLGINASQDVGGTVNDPDNKGPFELSAILSLDVPIQRRSARGELRRLQGRLAQLDRRAQMVRETVVAEVQDARSALVQSWARIDQSRENVRLAVELAEAERFQLGVGESDLLRVNLRESQAAEAAAELVGVLESYFRSLATYRAVLGIPSSE